MVCISRAAIQTKFPAQFQLLAAMNPCPCGQWGNPKAECLCTPDRISRYLAKLSAPLLDRIDMQITVNALSEEELVKPNENTPGQSILLRQKVLETQFRQTNRQGCLNAHLNAKECEIVCALGSKEQAFLNLILQRLKLSARAFHRLLKVARTIADIRCESDVNLTDLQQALSFKQTLQAPK